ncbi:MAG: type III-B CRISPR module-associated protein Cmr5 [Planctomycetota bacterium]|jgi:hypothetical protein|nr:type III-B CRISPR module-associated protein Cmr5 [Planctomycetota bacterium]
MKNREQIRARNALQAAAMGNPAGRNEGDVVKNIPTLIMNHGLLAVGAYAFDDKNTGYKVVIDALASHLADPEIALVPPDCQDTGKLLKHLVDADSAKLKLVTAEAMAWLNYARRFYRKG